mgnify:CR=1 FL=1
MFQDVYRNSRGRFAFDLFVCFCPVSIMTVVVPLSALLRLSSLFAVRASLCFAERFSFPLEK